MTDTIPALWKTAFVLPLHKKGSSDDLNNHRPISKLPRLVKVLERRVNNQLRSFLSGHAILNVFQSGFRPGHSTVSAAARVLNYIASALDNKQDCAALFINLKAFNTVDHSIHIKRLHGIGFDVKSLNWCENYLVGVKRLWLKAISQTLFVLVRGFLKVLFWGLYHLYIILVLMMQIVKSIFMQMIVIYSAAPSVELAPQNLQHVRWSRRPFHVVQRSTYPIIF